MNKIVLHTIAGGILLLTTGTCFAEKRTVLVETPDTCYQLGKVDGNKVYLQYTGKDCMKIHGKIEAEIDKSIRMMDLYDNGVFWKKQNITEFSQDDVEAKLVDLKKNVETDKAVTLPTEQALMKDRAAKVAADSFDPAAMQRAVDKGRNDALEVFADQLKDVKVLQDIKKKDADLPNQILPAGERIYIFISSSVPMDTLRQLVRSTAALDDHITFVMAGPIGGMKTIKPTYRFLADIAKVDPNCQVEFLTGAKPCDMYGADVILDPLLFRRYEIKEVPGIVYARDVKVLDVGSEGLDYAASVGSYYTVYGDVSFDYAVEAMQRASKSKILEMLLSKLRKGYY